MALTAGTRLGGYEILAALGVGAMGEVYRARDTRLRREVAIKVLPAALRDNPDRLARFAREAQVLAALNHPHIATLYGLEQDPTAGAIGPFLVMELVEGRTLDQHLPSLWLDGALAIARQLAAALEAAHDRGIVHRDLKPANIKITPAGVVKVLDFGLAKSNDGVRGDDPGANAPTLSLDARTEAGVVLGTAAYMSPEQARGLAVDRRTDIWAFGCVLFEMLAKVRVFGGGTGSDTLAAVLTREPDWSRLPAATPASTRRVLQRCLRKDPSLRLRDIRDARLELEEPADVDLEPDTRPTRHWPRSATVALAAAALVTAIAVGLAIRSASWARSAAAEASSGALLSRISWDASYSTEPALSPDGSLVVYASDRAGGGQLDLWLQRVAGGPPRRLTSDLADDREPDLSPDGSAIAFRSNRSGGGIYVMPALGGDARLVAERGRGPRYSPDGGRIAYWTGHWIGGPRTRGSAISVVPSNGGSPEAIAAELDVAHHPVWSPDGRYLLFFGGRSAGASAPLDFDWWRVSVDEAAEPTPTGIYEVMAAHGLSGTEENNTIRPSPDVFPGTWTTEGILFAARAGGAVNLWRVGVEEDTGRVLPDSLQRLTNGAGDDVLPVGRGDRFVAFTVRRSMSVSLTLPLDENAGLVRGPIERHSADAFVGSAGRNSMDASARWLVYPKVRPNESEIWLKDLTTGEERHLATTPPSQLNPVLSGDGQQIAYGLPEEDGIAGYVIPANGGTARKICAPCRFSGWLPDNRRILIILQPAERGAQRHEGRVQALDVSDGTVEDLLVGGSFGRADLSPQGNLLAFSFEDAIWIAPVRAAEPPAREEWTRIHQSEANTGERACGWSPDGRLLYLLLERDGFRDLYAQRVDPARGVSIDEPFVVQHLHDPRRDWGSTPSGTAIVNGAFLFNQSESSASVWLMDLQSPSAPRA